MPRPAPRPGAAPAGTGAVLRYAWPTVLSFSASSLFRVNDQFWVQGLGKSAQAGLGAATFLMVLNFAAYFLAVAGAMSIVARRTGAGDGPGRQSAVRHALGLGTAVGLAVGLVGHALTPWAAVQLGLGPEESAPFVDYVRTIYLGAVFLALAPLVDNVFISMGDTRTPLLLQLLAVGVNFGLNPLLIYHFDVHAPLAMDEPRMGMAGAALATVLSRAVAVGLGLAILWRRDGVRWCGRGRPSRALLGTLVRTGAPSSLSVAAYALVYVLLLRLVFAELPSEALAALGIGFNAFEGVAFPVYLGVAVAGASLVGRNLGAGREDLALHSVRSVRRVSLGLGLLFGALFYLGGPVLAPRFTMDGDVAREAVRYVQILAASQVFVALETSSEKVLLGAGHTRPIFSITVPGNALRIPFAYLLALTAGWGAPGVWWAINATTALKALALHAVVRRGAWRRLRIA